MREILFRGKRLDNGEWVEGYYTELPCGSLGATIFSNDDELVCEDTKSYIIKVFTKQHTNYSNSNPLQVIECEKYEVIPETVGQFTELTDKNGKKIFEGDIMQLCSACYPCLVYWDGKSWAWKQNGKRREIDLTREKMDTIGNIFDNPELFGE